VLLTGEWTERSTNILIWANIDEYEKFLREKLEPPPPRFYPYLEPGIDFRPETSPYFPKDFDIEKPPHDKYAQAPRYMNAIFMDFVQYNRKCRIRD